MKKFLIRISLFGFLLALVLVIGFSLPVTPRASKSLLFAQIKKDSLLVNTVQPRIIFVGGSNLSFGLNSQLIKDSLKLNPINTAIHAALGLKYMMDNTIQYIKKGDVIILSPEYNHFYGEYVYGHEELLRTVSDIDYTSLSDLDMLQLKSISKYFLKYCFSKFKPSEYRGFYENKIYSTNSFNKYGDAYIHWDLQPLKVNPAGEIMGAYNPNTVTLIDKFRVELERKGALLLITFPCLQEESFDNITHQIKKVEEKLVIGKFNLLSSPERYRIPDEMLYNTPYHLSKKGVDYRTYLLIQDIKKAL